MTYKLINKKTQEEHLCSKVEIDGFDYYVNDDKIEEGWKGVAYKKDAFTQGFPKTIIPHYYTTNSWYNDAKKVLATNNSNIDLPQVINKVEVQELAEINSEKHHYAFGQQSEFYQLGFIQGYNKLQETHSFSEDDMVEFVTWVKSYKFLNGTKQESDYSKKELLELWKEQQSKVIYFN